MTGLTFTTAALPTQPVAGEDTINTEFAGGACVTVTTALPDGVPGQFESSTAVIVYVLVAFGATVIFSVVLLVVNGPKVVTPLLCEYV